MLTTTQRMVVVMVGLTLFFGLAMIAVKIDQYNPPNPTIVYQTCTTETITEKEAYVGTRSHSPKVTIRETCRTEKRERVVDTTKVN